jgi:copper chaperone CopZ
VTPSVLRRLRAALRVHPVRLLTAPRLEAAGEDDGETVLRVHGLVCGVCAARTERALERLPGVEGARVDLATAMARIRHSAGPAPDREALDAALRGAVILGGVRRAIESGARRLRRAARGA